MVKTYEPYPGPRPILGAAAPTPATPAPTPKKYSVDPALREKELAARRERDKLFKESGGKLQSYFADPETYKRTKADIENVHREYDIQREASERALKAEGYELEARPYEFDDSKFVSPFLAEQMEAIRRSKGETGEQIAGMAVPQAEFRGTQSALASDLLSASRGEGPSVVQPAYRKALDEALSSTRAQALTSGLSPAMAARMATQETGKATTAAAGEAAIMKAQEQQEARKELASVAATARAGDLTLADSQQKYLQDMTKYYMDTGFTVQQAQFQATQDLEKQKAEQHATAQATAKGTQKSGGSTAGKVLSGIASFGLGLFSDMDLKENIKSGDKEITDFMKHLAAKKYDYKDKVGGEKEMVGVMAQDAEKSRAGKKIVDEVVGYKSINIPKALSLALAGIANLNKRIEKVEK